MRIRLQDLADIDINDFELMSLIFLDKIAGEHLSRFGIHATSLVFQEYLYNILLSMYGRSSLFHLLVYGETVDVIVSVVQDMDAPDVQIGFLELYIEE